MSKTILITGGSGFIGANLARALAAGTDRIFICARKKSDMWRLQGLDKAISIQYADMMDAESIRLAVLATRPNIVYHLATFGAYSYQKDTETIMRTNILGSVALFEALRETESASSIINVGSTSEYGFKENPMKEIDILEPNTTYGVAKAAQTHFATMYASVYQLPVITLRLSLVYGPYEEAGRLIPDIMEALVKNETLKLASPEPRRDFVFVEDVVLALQKAVERAQVPGSIFNIGSGVDYSVHDVVKKACSVIGRQVPLRWGSEDKKRSYNAAVNWIADVSKAREQLCWQPIHTLEGGLLKTYTWYNENTHFYNQ